MALTEKINNKLEFLLRGTTESPAVGPLAPPNIALPEDKDKPTGLAGQKKKKGQ